jgi:hypothetical protein
MPVPVGITDPALAAYLNELEERLATLEGAKSPTAMFAYASTDLTTAMAAANTNRQVFCTDLKVPACSNGVHWYRADTGAQII